MDQYTNAKFQQTIHPKYLKSQRYVGVCVCVCVGGGYYYPFYSFNRQLHQ